MEAVQVNYVLSILGILGLLCLSAWAWLDMLLSNDEKAFLIHSYLLTVFVILAEMGCTFTEGHAKMRIAALAFNAIGLGVAPFAAFLNLGIYRRSRDAVRNLRLAVPLFANLAIALLSPWTGWMFSVDAAGTYVRGPQYWVFVAAIVYAIFVFLVLFTRSMRHYPRYFYALEASCVALLLLTVIIQFAFPKVQVGWVGLMVFALMQYLFIAESRAMSDPLTGTLNRNAFDKQVDRQAESGNIAGTALVMVDINDFKHVNDTKGHPYGDDCLMRTAGFLATAFGEAATVYRYGGDEFVVLCANTTEYEVCKSIEAFMAAVREYRAADPGFPYAACGYEMWHDGETIPELLDAADTQMYKEKRAAR